jgi:hypothetical protein
MREINNIYTEKQLPSIRFDSYHYYPDRVSPEKIFVLACLDNNTINFSNQLAQDALKALEKQGLRLDHEEAMNRFDKVRNEYHSEQGSTQESTTGDDALEQFR